MQHLHAWPGYVTFGLTVVLLVGALRVAPALRLWVGLLLAVELVQIAVGLLAGAHRAADRAREHPHGARRRASSPR